MAKPYARAERGVMVAEAFCQRDHTDEYHGWLNVRHKDHNKPFIIITEGGYVQFYDLPFVETGVDGGGIPEGFEPAPMLDADDLRWIAHLAEEFSDKEPETLLKDVRA